jgi:serine/threonine protein kinase
MDIYGLGVLLYHLVTGSYPVEGRTREQVEAAHRRRERHHLRDVRPDLPEEFVQTVQRALDPDPRQRYQSAGAFESALARLLGATPQIEDGWMPDNRRRVAVALSAVALILTIGTAYWATNRRAAPPAAAVAAPATATPAPAAADAETYTIETALYRVVDGRNIRLRAGSQVEPGDNLFAELQSSVPTYVYIVNQDDRGESHMLFPLPGQSLSNPLPPGQPHRLPGALKDRNDQEVYWMIDKAGGREHFTIFASPARLDVLEHAFAQLPRPEIGKPILSARLPPETVGALRSVGGLAPAPTAKRPSSGPLTETSGALPLGDREETTRGVWVRQLTLDNPGR